MLYITRNGHPLPGSEGDPVKILWYTLSFFWVIGACQIIFSMLVICVGNADNTIYLNLAAGLVLVLLSFLAWGRSVVAMVLASLLCVRRARAPAHRHGQYPCLRTSCD